MQIRKETPQDAATISAVIDTAFRTAAHASGTEAQIVELLRSDGALILSLVAERSGAIVGHVAVSAATIGGQRGWALIGPLAVLPEAQKQGIGSALMNTAIEQLRAKGMSGAVLVGDPGYYGRFGFRARPGLTLHGIPHDVVLALTFAEAVPRGELAHHGAFGLDSPNKGAPPGV